MALVPTIEVQAHYITASHSLDLFRVWFTSVLYTIVTMPDLETWLTRDILPTWQFN